MSCALQSGHTIDCRDSIGGVKRFRLIEFANVTGITIAAGVVTAITKAATKVFYTFELPKETGNIKDDGTGSEQNGSIFYKHTATMILNKLQTVLRNHVYTIGMNKLMIVAEDRNGKGWLLGRDGGMYMVTAAGDSGTAAGDRSGWTITFEGTEPEPMIEVDAATLATLETA